MGHVSAQSSITGFIENKGQIIDQNGIKNYEVNFLHSKGPLHIQFRSKGFSYEIFEKLNGDSNNGSSNYSIRRIDIDFKNANDFIWEATGEMPDEFNFYGRSKIEAVHAYRTLTAKNVWNGVSIKFEIDSDNSVKYEFNCSDIDALKRIRLAVFGVEKIDINDSHILYKAGKHSLSDDFPKVYSQCDGERLSNFSIYESERGVIGFDGKSKKKCPIVIDPIPNLKWATYYGSGGSEHGYGVAADLNGDPFFCGSTTSSTNIATSGLGVYQVNYSGSDDAYLVKFLKDIDPTSQKSVRKWCTYFGDQGTDIAYNLAIDSGNNIYMVGESYYQSTSSILYRNKLQTVHGGKMDGFVAKFDKDGKLKWSNFFGGKEDEIATSVYIGKRDTSIVVVGQTASSLTHASTGGYKIAQSSNGGGSDAFVLLLDSAGNSKFSTYYGGSGTDIINDVAISRDSIFVVGKSNSTNFSKSTGSFSGNTDAFLAVFGRDGSHLSHLYLGGSSDDAANSINCLTDGGIYVAGTTNSASWSLLKGHQSNLNNTSSSSSQTDAFLIKVDAKFKNYWGTYYGGDLNEHGNGITTDRYNNVYLAGSTESSKHISTTDTYQDTIKGGWDAYLVKFYPSGTRHWGTYFGGGSNDYGQNVTKGEAGDVFMVGRTSSTSNLIYRAYQSSNNGSVDAYFADFNYCDKFLAIKKDTSCGVGNFNIYLTIDSSKFIKNFKGKLDWNYKFPSTYKIKWSGPNSFSSTNQNINRTFSGNSGTYTVIVVNDQGCTDTAKIDVNYSYPKPYFKITGIDTLLCNGDCNAKIYAGMTGGTAGKNWPKYKLSTNTNYSTSSTYSSLCAGTFTLNLIDSFGCKADTQIVIKQPSKLTVTSSSIVNVDCNGNKTGSITVSGTGGVTPYEFNINGGSYGTSGSFTSLASGNYTIGIKDKNGCTSSILISITQPTVLGLTVTSTTNVLCKGGSTGSVTVTGNGGTTPYGYSINGGSYASSGTFSGLLAGNYTITIKDANGCLYNTTITITEPSSAVSISTLSITDVKCNGATTGSITIVGTGGVSPYTYNISGGTYSSNTTFTSLAAGTYTLCVKDNNGCTSCSTVSVTQPSAITTSVSQINVSCNGLGDGSINLTPSGGVGPYTYYWTGPGTFTSSTQNISSLAAGTYNYKITDGNGCDKSGSVTILEPAALSVSISSNTPVDCNGNSTGILIAAGSGGTLPYTYNINGGSYASSSTFSNLVAGNYTIGIKDKNGCSNTVTAVVTEPTILDLTATNTVHVDCKGNSSGEVTVAGTGGTTPYQYSISGGSYSTSATFKSLSAGTYVLRVKDKNGCIKSLNVTITEPSSALSISLSTKVNVDCKGNSTGSIAVSASGGTGPYSYNIGGGTYGSSASFGTLAVGTYTVGVKDSKGCTASISISITEPSAVLSGSITQVNVSCNGFGDGNVTLSISGGTPGYKCYWTGPGTYTSTAKNPSSLSAGTYNFEITDTNNCKKTGTVTITEPSALSISSTSITDVLCKGNSTGNVSVSASGGTTPYSYNINGGSYGTSSTFNSLSAGTYTIGVKDKNGCTNSISVTIKEPTFSLNVVSVNSDVDCFGNSNGKLTLTGSGGTSPYSYTINGGTFGSSNTFSSLSAGVYSITIKDANGCTKTISDTVNQPTALSVSSTSTVNVDCKGGSTGSITVSGSGGTSPYSYRRSSSSSFASSNTFTGLSAGTYTIEVKDNNGCTSSVSVTITEPSTSLSGSTTQSNVTCNGLGDGSITLTTTGGTSSYSYSWTGPGTYTSTTQSPSSLAAGTYSYKITDSKGCTATGSATITEPTALSISISSSTNIKCKGDSTGSVTVSGSGGNTPYSYNIGGGTYGSSTTFSNLKAGTYTLGIKDKNGCTKSTTLTISEPSLTLSVVSSSVTNVLCKGSSTGSITVSGSGGTPSYTYNIGGGTYGSSNTFSSLSAGTYSIGIKDANGCTSSVSVTITEPSSTLTSLISQVNVSCKGLGDGSITLTPSGGTGTYYFNWTGPGTYTSTTQNPSSLVVGNYSLKITDANGCTYTNSVTITEPSTLTIGSSNIVNVDCKGNSTGSFSVSGSGGTTPYQYSISGGSFVSSGNFSGLGAGNYSVTIKDKNGCTASTTVTITEPQSLSFTTSITHVDCKGASTGAISISATGGTTSYSYNLNSGSYVTNASFNGLTAGTYTMGVKDANGCTSKSTVVVVEPSSSVSVSVFSKVDVDCKGNSTGSVTVVGSGGTGPYTYNISAGSYSSNTTFSNLIAGTYTLGIKDKNGCTSTTTVTIAEPSAILSASLTQINVSCKGLSDGSIALTPSGGTSPYQFYWTGPSTFTSNVQSPSGLLSGSYNYKITDKNGCVITGSTTITEPAILSISYSSLVNVDCKGNASGSFVAVGAGGTPSYNYNIGGGAFSSTNNFTGLTAGNYTVGIKDANGCLTSMVVSVTEPSLSLGLTSTVTNVDCKGNSTGLISLSSSGGTSPYTYSLNGGTYGSSSSFSGLKAGTYTMSVKDANGCTKSLSVTISEPTIAVSLSVSSVVDVDCKGNATGSISVAGSGGTSPYYYNIGGGSYGTNTLFNKLSAGTYTMGVKDANGCSTTILVTVGEPTAALLLITNQTNVSCNGLGDALINTSATGGTSAYTYNIGGGSYGSSTSFTNLAAGTYTIGVKDSKGCINTNSVTITEPNLLSVSVISSTHVKCKGDATGEIKVSGNGGTTAYTYNINGGTYGSSTTFSGLVSGNYTIGIKDKNGCTASVTTTITEPPQVVLTTTSIKNIDCKGSSTGAISITASGGTSPYTYNINSGGYTSSLSFTGLPAGSYTLGVKDDNGCKTTITVTLTEPTVLSVSSVSITDVDCNGNKNGVIVVSGSGGVSPYTYNINGGSYQFSSTFSGLAGGNYTIGVKDNNGCINSTTLTVKEPASALSLSHTQQNATCNGLGDGSVTLNASGGTSPYEYNVGSGTFGSSNVFGTLAAGNYTFGVKDKNGCQTTINVSITQPNVLELFADSIYHVDCKGNSTGAVLLSGKGGTTAYRYNISGGTYQIANKYTALSAGTYSVGIKDKNGCVTSKNITINEPGQLTMSIGVSDVSCDGGSDGRLTVTASGGTPKYQYKLGSSGAWQNSNQIGNLSKGSYTVYLRDSNLCSTSSSASVSESVVMQPLLDISSAVNLCLGSTHYFSGSRSAINSGSFSVKWDFGDGDTASGVTVGHKYVTTGTYTVTMTMLGSTGCKKVVKETVKVYPVPVVQFCPIDVLNNCINSQCLRGNIFKFKSTSYIANGSINQYDWDFGDGNKQSGTALNSVDYTYKNAGSYTAKLTLKSDNGCINQGDYTIVVKSHPLAKAAVNSADSCYKLNYFDFTSNGTTAVSGSVISSYSWKFGTGSLPGSSTVDMPSGINYSSEGIKNISLIVEDANKCSDTTKLTVVIYSSPQPKIVLHSTTPKSTQCFKGNSFRFENKTTIKTGTLTYKWDFGDGTTSTAENPPPKTYSKEGDYTVRLVATSNIGCVESITYQVVVLASPKADFSTNAICSTSYSIIFYDASIINSGKLNSYEWEFGDKVTSKVKNPSHTYTNSGSYTVTFMVESDLGCRDTVVKNVSAYDKISAKFDVQRNNCGINSQIQFTNKSLAPTSSNYNWDFGDNTQSSQTNPIHQFNRADTFLVTLKVLSPDGCEATAKESVFVYTDPEADFDVSSLICNNSAAVQFTNKSRISADTLFNSWEFGDGNTSVQKSPSHTYSNFGTYSVKLTVKTSKGCSDVISKTINVRPKPQANFNITSLDPCLSTNSITMENGSSISSGTYNYRWILSDGKNINNVSPFKHSFKKDTVYSIKLIVESTFGCKDSMEKSTEIFANPLADIYINNSSQCLLNNNFEFRDSSIVKTSGGIAKHFWDFGDGTLDTVSGPKVFKSYASYGDYYVELRVINQKGCEDKVKQLVKLYDMPVADFSVNADKQCFIGNDFNFYNKSKIVTGNGTLGYDWEFGDGNVSSNISPNNQFSQPGTYNITLLVTSSFGCQNTIIKPIEVYQNPDAPNITVDRTIPCYGMLGSLKSFVTGGILPYQYSWNGGNFTSNGNIDSIPAGWYYLEVIDKNGCKNKDSFELNQPDELSAKVIKVSDALCFGFSNASAKLDSIKGGVGPYYAEWFLGSKLVKVGVTLSGVKANQTDLEYYKVLLRDLNGCTLRDSVHLSQPSKMEGQLYVLNPIKCYGSLGSIAVTVKGGVKNPNRWKGYDFYWNGSRNPGKDILAGIQAGVQRVIVYDSNGCSLALSMELKEPTKLIGSIDSVVNVRCYGDRNGRIYGSAKGGLKDYRYYWTDTFNGALVEGQKFDGVGAGFYKLVVKDRNGCVDSIKNWVEVLQPDRLALSVLENMNITCHDGKNGKFRVAASGGNGNYRYEWQTDPIRVVDSLIDNLPSGKYIIKVSDQKGCLYETSYTLNNPPRNPVTVPNDSIEVCQNDTMMLSASINQSRYYYWKYANQVISGSRDSLLTISNVQKYQGGDYTVIGVDEQGCEDSAKVFVMINDLPTVDVVSNPMVACLGSICNLEATGANKYFWYKERYSPVYGRDTLSGNTNVYKIQPVSGNDVGRYFVQGETVQGCKNESSVIVKVGLDSITVPNDTQVCAGGKILLRARGAVSYEWKAPNGNVVLSPSYLVNPAGQFDSGIYQLKVVDRWNCEGNYKVAVMVNPRPKLTIVDKLFGEHCEGDDVEIIANTDASRMSWFGPNFRKLNTTQSIQVIPSVTVKDQGEYKLIGYSVFGCMDSTTTLIKVNPLPIVDFGYTHNCPPNPIAGEDVNFFSTSLRASKYEFYLDNLLVSKEAGFKTKFVTPGSYVVKLKAMNEYGCYKELSQAILVEDPWKLWVPNAFTPNNDRLNSEFKPVTLNVPNYKMYIYDRWGGKIFEGENNAWDGKILGQPAPIGVYAVIVEHSTICSDDKTILDKSVKTEVTIIR